MTGKPSAWQIAWDEGRLQYELGVEEKALSLHIREEYAGAAAEMESSMEDMCSMTQALRLAIIDGGRMAYEEELTRWEDRGFYEKFRRDMDDRMTRMPYPREAATAQDRAWVEKLRALQRRRMSRC